jgi:hypothetical protein
MALSSIQSFHLPRLLIGALAALALSGCGHHFHERHLVSPTAPEAQDCIARCDQGRVQCEGRQRGRESECRVHFERLTADLDACRATPSALCVQPDACFEADMSVCEIQYEECIVACGGKVETRFTLSGSTSS